MRKVFAKATYIINIVFAIKFSVLAAIFAIAMFSCGDDTNEKTLVSIEVTAQPTKKVYAVNDTFDPAGMTVTATYSDETTEPVTVTAAMLDYDFSTAGQKTVTITYKGKTATVTDITVNPAGTSEKTLESIAVTTQPTKKTYMVGEAFDPAGMVVTATYSDGSTAPVNVTAAMITFNSATAGTNLTATVTYEGKTAIVTGITVNVVVAGHFCGGTGTEADPYQICTTEQLVKLAELVNSTVTNKDYCDKYYILINNISLAEYGEGWNDDKGWIPIGKESYGLRFSGHFGGNNKKVSGLYLNDDQLNYAGLFGYINDGTIQNLSIEGSVTGKNYVGGMAGSGGEITDCNTNVTVSGNEYVGGIVGYYGYSTNCHSTGNVSGVSYVGGITGGGGAIFSYSTGTITGAYAVGGIAGVGGATNSYSTGAVIGVKAGDRLYAGNSVGGVVGRLGSDIINCYSTGNVSGGMDFFNGSDGIGGVLGSGSSGKVTNCYSTGNVSGYFNVGGVAGDITGNAGGYCEVTNCYATGVISGDNVVGGIVGRANLSAVEHCVALNPSIDGSECGRVSGYYRSNFYTNLAWDGMTVYGVIVTNGSAGNQNGADITSAQAKDWNTYGGWSFDGKTDDCPWVMGIGSYPLPVFYWQTAVPVANISHLN